MKKLFLILLCSMLFFACKKDEDTSTKDDSKDQVDDNTDDDTSDDDTTDDNTSDIDLSALDYNTLYVDGTTKTKFNYFKFAPSFNSTKVTISFSELENEFESGQDGLYFFIDSEGDNYLPSGSSYTYNYQKDGLGSKDGEWSFKYCPEENFPDEVYDCHTYEANGLTITSTGSLITEIDGNQITLLFKDYEVYGTKYSGKFRFSSSEVFASDYAGEWIEGAVE